MLYSLNTAENSGLLKQRRFPEDYRCDSKHASAPLYLWQAQIGPLASPH
ncbi:hypothetical protein TSAR_009656 [Trichomalopsis sarcophagae]|uniref:Uncharacterized protein n=1 Tax=Trichomalopsis sarcophagae TaxID=543379 RepID=A0A232ELA6_9HYME|nr:hypothetical protein TSAR_009656 [Trichomalopsis sarcophagae]